MTEEVTDLFYHYSPRANITAFRHFSHFGTRKAAEEVYLRKLREDGNGHSFKEALHTLYTVVIDLRAANWIELEDSDSPTPASLALHLNAHFKSLNEPLLVENVGAFSHFSVGLKDSPRYDTLELSDCFIEFARDTTNHSSQQIKERCRAEGYRILARELIKRGYAGIRYPNRHEDVGSTSISVADMSKVAIIRKELISSNANTCEGSM